MGQYLSTDELADELRNATNATTVPENYVRLEQEKRIPTQQIKKDECDRQSVALHNGWASLDLPPGIYLDIKDSQAVEFPPGADKWSIGWNM